MNRLQKIEIENEFREIAKALVEEAREADSCQWSCNGDDIAYEAARRAVALIGTVAGQSGKFKRKPIMDEKLLKDKLTKVFYALDRVLGDTDPDLPEDMTDDEIRQEEPVFWAAREIDAILQGFS